MRDVEHYVAQAHEQTGLSDLGDDDWREGLERLLDAFEDEARLSEIGVAVVETDLVGYLVEAARSSSQWRKDHPEIARAGRHAADRRHRPGPHRDDDPPRPPRAGSGEPRAARVGGRPSRCRRRETATYDTDPRIARDGGRSRRWSTSSSPASGRCIPIGAQLAQECVRITGSAFRSMIFPTQYRVPSYGHWLLHEADMAPGLPLAPRVPRSTCSREHPGERWVLKSPGHIWCLDALLAEYPDALLVQTHRDPLKIIASVSSLMALLRRLACDDPTMAGVRRGVRRVHPRSASTGRSTRARTGPSPPIASSTSSSRDFMSDQIGTIRTIYDRFGLELTAGGRAADADVPRRAPAGQARLAHLHVRRHGLDAGETRERAQRYQDVLRRRERDGAERALPRLDAAAHPRRDQRAAGSEHERTDGQHRRATATGVVVVRLGRRQRDAVASGDVGRLGRRLRARGRRRRSLRVSTSRRCGGSAVGLAVGFGVAVDRRRRRRP